MLSSKEIDESNYKHIYYKNLPDKNIEFFWYNFKESIINILYNLDQETKNLLKNHDIIGDLYKLSNNLYTTRKWWEKNYGIEKTSKKLRNFLYLQYPEILENITQVSFNI